MYRHCLRKVAAVTVLFGALSLAAVRDSAALVISGTSTAYGEFVNLTFTPIVGPSPPALTSGPFPALTLSAPPPYNVAGGVPIVLPFLSVGGVGVHVSSDVDGLPGIRFAEADAGLTTINLTPVPFFTALPGLFTLTLTGASSMADVTGDFGALTPTGTTTLTGGVLSFPFLGLGPIVLSASPAANTQVGLPALGFSVLLNEQIPLGNGTSTQSLEVNAIHIGLLLPVTAPNPISPLLPPIPLGTLSGDIILAHSEALLLARPLPPPPPPVDAPAPLALLAAAWLAMIAARRIRPG